MNVGSFNGNREQHHVVSKKKRTGHDEHFDDIRFSRPLKQTSDAEFQTARKLADPDEIIATDTTEFSPIKVLTELEETGRLDAAYFTKYTGASNDFVTAKQLVKEFCKPVFKYANSCGRDLPKVKAMMREAILEHIDLSQLKEAHQRIKDRKPRLSERAYQGPVSLKMPNRDMAAKNNMVLMA